MSPKVYEPPYEPRRLAACSRRLKPGDRSKIEGGPSQAPEVLEGAVKPYTFYLHESRRESPSFQFVACEDDDDARNRAHGLFERRPCLMEVEVYDGRRSRFRVGRPRLAPTEEPALATG